MSLTLSHLGNLVIVFKGSRFYAKTSIKGEVYG
jgi:hypothetical protein